jgi:NodT family efflux transporter outer membrane factor (OMF) lipoprotein
MSISRIAALYLLVCLAGCATHQDIQPQARVQEASDLGSLPLEAQADWRISQDYWRAFGDAQLDSLVDEALAASPSLALADARIRRAIALTDVAGSALRPQVDANFSSVEQRFSERGMVSSTYAGTTQAVNLLTLDARIELDTWGKYRYALEGAELERRASELESAAAHVALAAAVTCAYLEFDHQHRQLALIDRLIALRVEAERLQAIRVSAGLDAEIDRNLQQLSIAQLRSERAQLEERIGLQANALAALTGQGPERGARLGVPTVRDELDAHLPSQLPSDLLANRPDLRAAQLRVKAAGKDIEVARAEFYPSVNLSAFLGLSSVGLNQLLDPKARIAGIGPAIRLPMFEAGRLRAGLAVTVADYDAAVEAYNASLVEALREVCDQARRLEGASRQGARVAEGLTAAERGVQLVRARVGQGLASQINLITVQMQLLTQQRAALDVRAHRLDSAVRLVRALGGGLLEQNLFAPASVPQT